MDHDRGGYDIAVVTPSVMVETQAAKVMCSFNLVLPNVSIYLAITLEQK
jgi:hypothetical protein